MTDYAEMRRYHESRLAHHVAKCKPSVWLWLYLGVCIGYLIINPLVQIWRMP